MSLELFIFIPFIQELFSVHFRLGFFSLVIIILYTKNAAKATVSLLD